MADAETLAELRDLAETVDRSAESFRSSLPYQPPEAVWHLFREKLVWPLSRLKQWLEENPAPQAEAPSQGAGHPPDLNPDA